MVAAREGEGMRLKEPERITLVEGLELLEQYGPAEQAKARLRQAFIQKGFRQEPLFAFSYEDPAVIAEVPPRDATALEVD